MITSDYIQHLCPYLYMYVCILYPHLLCLLRSSKTWTETLLIHLSFLYVIPFKFFNFHLFPSSSSSLSASFCSSSCYLLTIMTPLTLSLFPSRRSLRFPSFSHLNQSSSICSSITVLIIQRNSFVYPPGDIHPPSPAIPRSVTSPRVPPQVLNPDYFDATERGNYYNEAAASNRYFF